MLCNEATCRVVAWRCEAQVLSAEARKGVTDRGITEFAFKKLLLMFITQSRPDSTWTVLRHFNYDQNLDLVIPGDVLDVNPQPGQLVELNATGISFLSALFEQFSVVRDGAVACSQRDGVGVGPVSRLPP